MVGQASLKSIWLTCITKYDWPQKAASAWPSVHTKVYFFIMPFGISSVPGHFQQIMNELTCNLPGVAVYLDDILVSRSTVEKHLWNLQHVLKRLENKGLHCRKSKCLFAQPRIEYLGHVLTFNSIAKSPKVDAVIVMPPPAGVESLCSFLGAVQFYSKFLQSNFSTFAEQLYRLVQSSIL